DAHGVFPAGCDAQHYSVAAHLLPYIEQDNLYKSLDRSQNADSKANATTAATRIKLYLSPLDPLDPEGGKTGPTNYPFNAGSRPSLADNDGVFFHGSKIRMTEIVNGDGASNTLMAGETMRGDGGKAAQDVLRQHVRLKKEALKGLKPDAGVKEWKASSSI